MTPNDLPILATIAKSLIECALMQDLRLRLLFVRKATYMICSISFIVKKQREGYIIDLPKSVLAALLLDLLN